METVNCSAVSIYDLFSVSSDSPLKPLVPDMEMTIMDSASGITIGEMTRVDDSVQQEPVIKIKSLLPPDHLFQNFCISSASVLRLLSSNQAEHVMDMLAKASYVR